MNSTDLLKILLFLLGVFGNAWFWTSWVNRLFSYPIRDALLHRLRKLHDFALFLVPLLLAYSLYLWTPAASAPQIGRMFQGFLQQVGWSIPFWLLAVAGFLMFVRTKILSLTRTLPPGYQQTQTEILDTTQLLGKPPLGPGPYQNLLKVPGNQILTAECNQKQFQFSTLPTAFNQLKILHVSDLHFIGTIDRSYFETVLEYAQDWQPDLILFTGDLIDDPQLLDWIPTTLGKLSASLGCFYVLGNHDWHQHVEPIRQQLNDLGWKDCAGALHTLTRDSEQIVLAGDERPWMGDAPDFSTAPATAFRILLSHTPDNFSWAQKDNVDLMLSGHNHGGQVKLPLIGPVYAPSRHGVRYTDGVFYQHPTTLHVSRGLSGRHPLRIRCRPEITLLTLVRQPN